MSDSFAGKIAVVTGTHGGIGAATVALLADRGAQVVAVDVQTPAFDPPRRDVDARSVDLADASACSGLIADVVAQYDRIDILVNNAAAHGSRVRFVDLDAGDWNRVVATNLTAIVLLCRDAARAMIAAGGGGAIVNVSSIQERIPAPTYAGYVATKGGIGALTRALAADLGEYGIRVNAVAPGVIATESFRDLRDGVMRQSAAALGRFGRPEEAAAAIAFLAGDAASFVTGVTLPVDGGRLVSRRTDPVNDLHGPE